MWVGKVCWLANTAEGSSLAQQLVQRDAEADGRP